MRTRNNRMLARDHHGGRRSLKREELRTRGRRMFGVDLVELCFVFLMAFYELCNLIPVYVIPPTPRHPNKSFVYFYCQGFQNVQTLNESQYLSSIFIVTSHLKFRSLVATCSADAMESALERV